MKRILFFLFFVGIGSIASAQYIERPKKVEWMSLTAARDSFTKRQKPILIFLYNIQEDSSKLMLDSVFTQKDVISYLNGFFYCVKINTKSKSNYRFFNDSLFQYNPNLNVHPIANFLTAGINRYPSLVVFQKNGTGELFSGFYDQNHLFPILIYYAEEAYRTVTYDEYLKYFRKVYPEENSTGYSMVRSVTKWHSLEEALELQKKNPKKILIDFYLNERNLSTIQYMYTYNNKDIGEYINEHFYAVRINGTGKDTITAFGATYTNPGIDHPFHQLAVAMLNGLMYFPSIMILDESAKMLDRVQAYLRPEDIEPILNFYGEDFYKTQKYPDFKKSFKSKLPTEIK